MSIETQLFEGNLVRLTPIDHEKDPEVESRWTHDLVLGRALWRQPAMPLSVAKVKKKNEAIEKDVDESKRLFHFMIRDRQDNRLLGFVRKEGIEWSHATGSLKLAIGDRAERGKGFGGEALELMLRFAFSELNLRRVTLDAFEYNPRAIRCCEKAGFVYEGRAREYLCRKGLRWDLIFTGILREEWSAGTG